ncbi:Glycosyltransferase involved in cell wall bisynthesis [[Clostridium] aminophilum]|uniref:Glycosyltransferase involved in cell wall bisynthesis n=1 Tax=[Clostridium] aminophilum TaxID=1526 RepID=A0A1I0FLA9_9FIRM|nr:glycosyltransferase [[Clostridium] aminophilum]SET58884.1 Glycosyltransferase involved in cell wall bisynthesis [[Clostridium] aminophilum]
MKVLIVHYGDVDDFPPVKSLINAVLELGHKVTVGCCDRNGYILELGKSKDIRLIDFGRYHEKTGIINHVVKPFRLRQWIEAAVSEADLTWSTTFWTGILFRKAFSASSRHVMQLMELQENSEWYNLKRLYLGDSIRGTIGECARRSWKVVVPEYNRAHIVKAWWNLEETPTVLPNKPYFPHNSAADRILPEKISSEVQEKIDFVRFQKKKIVLYQGVFWAERNLNVLAEAIEQLGDEYVLCIMGRDNAERQRLCRDHPGIVYLGYISAPCHLEITKYAHIGVLTYYPQKSQELNALYCAPNKLFEYAYCQIPMIGNDIPGLSYPFEKYGIGKCSRRHNAKDICDTIRAIEEHYDEMKRNCMEYYNSVDFKAAVADILQA